MPASLSVQLYCIRSTRSQNHLKVALSCLADKIVPAGRRGIEPDPPLVGKKDLDPGVGVAITHQIIIAKAVKDPAFKPDDDLGLQPEGAGQHGQGRGEILAMPMLSPN